MYGLAVFFFSFSVGDKSFLFGGDYWDSFAFFASVLGGVLLDFLLSEPSVVVV